MFDVLACQSGTSGSLEWAGSGGGAEGLYGYFDATSCPDGWIAADGQNGTVDLRGEFIRGWDNGRGVDSGRALGSPQRGQLERHKHVIPWGADHAWIGAFGRTAGSGKQGSDGRNGSNYWYHTNDGSAYNGQVNPSGVIGHETRPRNRALLACMGQ